MNSFPVLVATVATVAAALALPALAAPVIFQGVPGDRATFFTSVGATPSYTEDFETISVAKDAPHAQFTEAGITYRQLGGTNVWVSSPGYSNYGAGVPQPTTTSILTATGDEHFEVLFGTPADVVAMDVYLNGLGPLSITFFNGATTLGVASWASGNDVRFVGFDDALPVTRLEFISTLGGRLNTGIDNLAVATGGCTNCIPEPGALALALTALGLLGGFGAAGRRQRGG